MAAPATATSRTLRARLPLGIAANEALTATVATALLLLLTVEAATALDLRNYLGVHAFVGVLLLPVVCLKLVSTGWRMTRYYLGAEEYVLRGPPHVAVRMLVAPVVVVSTVFLFGTGVALLALGETHGQLVGLHAASFAVWIGAMGVHVLTRIGNLPAAWRRLPGRGLRVGLVAATVAAGVGLAVLTLPAVDRLQDRVTAHARFDDH
jgi:hypothetical protein